MQTQNNLTRLVKSNNLYLFGFIIIALITFESCSIQKRHYRSGYYVNWKKHTPNNSKDSKINEIPALTTNKVESNSLIVASLPAQNSSKWPVVEDKNKSEEKTIISKNTHKSKPIITTAAVVDNDADFYCLTKNTNRTKFLNLRTNFFGGKNSYLSADKISESNLLGSNSGPSGGGLIKSTFIFILGVIVALIIIFIILAPIFLNILVALGI